MKKIFLLLGVFIIFSSCNTFTYKKINIDNYNFNNEIRIKDEKINDVYIHGLYCKINGKVNNVIELLLTNNDGLASYKIVPKNGKINFIYDADWYSNEFIIKILYNNEPNGYINIVYKFRELYNINYDK